MAEPKPIETRYAGCRFRSRLEARWAVFFDRLGIEWHYEAEGLQLPDGTRYLPDFYLPRQDQWVEVKGTLRMPDLRRIVHAAAALRPAGTDAYRFHTGVMVLGPVPRPADASTHTRYVTLGGYTIEQGCYFALNSRLSYDLRPIGEQCALPVDRLNWSDDGSADAANLCSRVLSPQAEPDLRIREAVADAYRAARSARFEHGESGTAPSRPVKPRKVKTNPGVGYLRGTLVRIEQTYDLATVDGRVSALREMAPVIAAVNDDALRAEWITIAANRLGLPGQADAVERSVSYHRGLSRD